MRYRFIVLCGLLTVIAPGCGSNHSIPTATSRYTASAPRTMTNSQTPIITLDAESSGPTVAPDAYGASIATWYDFLRPFVNPSLHKTGIKLVRFPGGSESDVYHWEHGGTLCNNQGYITKGATFDNFMRRLTGPLSLDVAITLNYGSNRACNGGGDPSEAGAWAAHAKQRGFRVTYWTVGNEVYGSWEYDLHARPHDPQTYSDAVRTGYYPAVKKADPNAQLGIVVDTPADRAWNDVVLRKAQPFDFVEVHFYPEYQVDNDRKLLGPDIGTFASDLKALRAQMRTAGVADSIPIYLGEFNNDAGAEGKQSVSIVNGLYLGQMLGTLIEAGVPMSTWWLAYGSCDQGGDFSKKLYGWQNFGSEALFSDDLPEYGCYGAPHIPGGTPFPTARVMALFSGQVPAGSQVRTTSVPPSLHSNVRAYGFAEGGGYAFVIFNNTLSPIDVKAQVKNTSKNGFTGHLATYGKAQYDRSKQNRWIGPVYKNLGTVPATIPLSLPAYSVSVLALSY